MYWFFISFASRTILVSLQKCNNNSSRESTATINEDSCKPMSHFPDTRYADFTFWKPLLPTIDDEIAALLRDDNRKPVTDRTPRHQFGALLSSSSSVHRFDSGCEAKFASEYNEFNFWRVPVAEIDIDFSRILASNERWIVEWRSQRIKTRTILKLAVCPYPCALILYLIVLHATWYLIVSQ